MKKLGMYLAALLLTVTMAFANPLSGELVGGWYGNTNDGTYQVFVNFSNPSTGMVANVEISRVGCDLVVYNIPVVFNNNTHFTVSSATVYFDGVYNPNGGPSISSTDLAFSSGGCGTVLRESFSATQK